MADSFENMAFGKSINLLSLIKDLKVYYLKNLIGVASLKQSFSQEK